MTGRRRRVWPERGAKEVSPSRETVEIRNGHSDPNDESVCWVTVTDAEKSKWKSTVFSKKKVGVTTTIEVEGDFYKKDDFFDTTKHIPFVFTSRINL